MNNSSESLHILFQHGAQPTQANSSALLPLHVAASQDSVECVQLITRHFPHVKKLRGGRQQLNAQQIAQAVGASPQIMQCLGDRDDGVDESDIYTGVVMQDSGNSLASRLNKASSSTFKKLETMLVQACKLRDLKFVYESIPPDKIAGVSNGRTETGMTLLHCACRHSSAAVVLYLIQSRGFKCDVVTATGDSALHLAVLRIAEQQQSLVSIRVLQALLSCVQAEWITMFNSQGLNPLHLAAQLSCMSATKLIFNSSPHAILCCTERSGQNVIHIAAQLEQPSFTEFLLSCVQHAGFSTSNCSMIQDKSGRTARAQAVGVHENGGRGQFPALLFLSQRHGNSHSVQGGTSSLEERPTSSHHCLPVLFTFTAFRFQNRGFFHILMPALRRILSCGRQSPPQPASTKSCYLRSVMAAILQSRLLFCQS
jgi:ankyrin repeat protein